jgi:uncharacterized membrane protein (DUF106 family)
MTEENLTENKDSKEDKPETLLENKSAKETIISSPSSNKKAKEGSFKTLIIFMLFATILAGLWDKIPAIKNSIHYVLDPSAGALLNWNLSIGMIIIVIIMAAITTIVQKYATDQKTLKELKAEQKEIQKQTKEFKDHPEKMMELQKKQMAMMPKQMKLSMRSIIYTGIPFILLFRWFYDYFAPTTSVEGLKFLGFWSVHGAFLGIAGWIWFYLVTTMVFSSLLRKWWDVV